MKVRAKPELTEGCKNIKRRKKTNRKEKGNERRVELMERQKVVERSALRIPRSQSEPTQNNRHIDQ